MASNYYTRKGMKPLLIFLLVNFVFYSWVIMFHTAVSFNNFEYRYSANHYITDPRVEGKGFSLINALGQYDSQWYLRIADKGYPDHPQVLLQINSNFMGVLLYNFFPFYPICIAMINFFIRNVQLSAFIFNNILLLASVYSIYFVVSKWFSKEVALKTILLLLLFPFSVFLRGYYAEGMRLFLFIWFCYGLTEKRYLIAAISVGLLCITSGISLLFLPFYWGVLLVAHKKHKVPLQKIIFYAGVSVIPFVLWMFFCYVHTGNPLIFVLTRSAWQRPTFSPLLYNMSLIFSYPTLPFISIYGSRLDVSCIIVALCLTYLSRNILPRIVWLATIILAFSPLLVQDSVSFARFSTVFFPVFVYLAVVVKKNYYIVLLCFFIVGLLVSSLYFINWYWIE